MHRRLALGSLVLGLAVCAGYAEPAPLRQGGAVDLGIMALYHRPIWGLNYGAYGGVTAGWTYQPFRAGAAGLWSALLVGYREEHNLAPATRGLDLIVGGGLRLVVGNKVDGVALLLDGGITYGEEGIAPILKVGLCIKGWLATVGLSSPYRESYLPISPVLEVGHSFYYGR